MSVTLSDASTAVTENSSTCSHESRLISGAVHIYAVNIA